MKILDLRLFLLSVLCITACGNLDDRKAPDQEINLLPGGPAWGALYQQRAGEYKALFYQAYNIANLRLEQYVKDKSNLPKAIITDIDETVLDNSPYFVERAKQGKTYSDSSWIAWTARINCDTLPGSVQFLKRASKLGVSVFYVTNRFSEERQATLKNLQKFNLPCTDDEHLFVMGQDGSSKERRRIIISKNYDVILFLGDNLGDFGNDFDVKDPLLRTSRVSRAQSKFGSHFVIFPNTMYGSWEDRLYPSEVNSLNNKNQLLNGLLK